MTSPGSALPKGLAALTLPNIARGIAISFLVATGFVAAKIALTSVSPLLVAAIRYTIATAVMVWFFKPPDREFGKLFIVAFISATLQFAFTYLGIQRLPISTAALLIQAEVPFLIILGSLLLGQKLLPHQLTGVVLSLIGTFIILGTPELNGEFFGMVLVLLGGFTWALGQISIAWIKSMSGFRLATWVGVMATVQLWCGTLLIDGDPRPTLASLDFTQVACLVFIGVGTGAIGMGLWYQLVDRVGASYLTPFLLLIPVIGVLQGILFLGDPYDMAMIAGGCITLIGVALALQPRRALPKSPPGQS
jgi:O-acetylserine/cysteine efflux transporter